MGNDTILFPEKVYIFQGFSIRGRYDTNNNKTASRRETALVTSGGLALLSIYDAVFAACN